PRIATYDLKIAIRDPKTATRDPKIAPHGPRRRAPLRARRLTSGHLLRIMLRRPATIRSRPIAKSDAASAKPSCSGHDRFGDHGLFSWAQSRAGLVSRSLPLSTL